MDNISIFERCNSLIYQVAYTVLNQILALMKAAYFNETCPVT